MNVVLVACLIVMVIAAIIELVRSRGESLISWGVLVGGAGLLYWALTP